MKSYSASDLPSPGISVELHADGDTSDGRRPAPLVPHLSAPAVQIYHSPLRQHKRTPSHHREVKETLDARFEYTSDDLDGRSHHKINQYTIKEEIGRGSYGAVHLATDQYGHEYAVKEFSKARLRKRAKSNILRHGPRRPARFSPGPGLGRPFSRALAGSRDGGDGDGEASDALFLIREEIAIMKKMNHPSLVQLIEVLDDPEEDSLYMVLEMCKKGVIMKVGLDQPADPYPEEACRHWFRDLILGIEYLHEQGVVHRDIKPDNLLLTDDDVLKIVDFGVSEMFEKPDEMRTNKTSGSPAFLPPELCVVRHGDVSGRPCDIWSMGVSLYCLRYGRLPFEHGGVLELYEAIKKDETKLPPDENGDFLDLMRRLLQKDPNKRIRMEELREHPWVTKQGTDPLLSKDENCSALVEPPNALELNHAFTRRMSHLLCVMKAISKFKSLISSRASTPQTGVARAEDKGSSARQQLPAACEELELSEEDKQHARDAARLVEERVTFLRKQSSQGEKGHAHDPTDTEPRFLGIGTGGRDDFQDEPPADVVSDSPTAVDFNIYDSAYKSEVKRIQSQRRKGNQKMYMTKLLKEREQFRTDSDVQASSGGSPSNESMGSVASSANTGSQIDPATAIQRNHKFAELVTQAVKNQADGGGPVE